MKLTIRVAQETTAGTNDTQKAAPALSEMSSQLRRLVGNFKLDNQAAAASSLHTSQAPRTRAAVAGVEA